MLRVDNSEFFSKVTEILSDGKNVRIPVKGSSMLPFIRGERDHVELEGMCGRKPVTGSRHYLQKGDIVLFCLDGKYIIHRVIEPDYGDGNVLIQGDGVLDNVEICPENCIYGRVVTIYRNDGNRSRPIDPESPGQRLLSNIWLWLRPLRRYLLGIYRRLPWNAMAS